MPRPSGHPSAFWGDLHRRTNVEWIIVCAALILLTLLLSLSSRHTGLQRLDFALYDMTLAATSPRPADPDILIVAIDDGSIAHLGHWPWRRTVHAQLLQRLGMARAVAMDILFTDPQPQFAQDDAALAQAIAAHGRVLLPKVVSASGTLMPLAHLQQAAAGIGAINVWPDSDGIVRAIDLAPTDAQGQRQEHLVLTMLSQPHTAAGTTLADTASRPAQALPSGGPRLLPYAGPPGHFRFISYAAVLEGIVPPETFRDKFVFVGTWGTGLGDTFPTPLSDGIPMAGVEILANSLQSARENLWVRTLPAWLSAALAALPVLLACLLVRRRSPRQAFFNAMAIVALVLAAHWILLHFLYLWVPIVASLIGTILCYPVWSWRTQDISLKHVDHELQKLQDEQTPFKESLLAAASAPDQSLSARIVKLHNAIDQLRNLRQFFTDSLDATPDATIVFDASGIVRFASRRAKAYANALQASPPRNGMPAEDCLARIAPNAQQRHEIVLSLQRGSGLPPQGAALPLWQGDGLELQDASGNDMLLKCVSIRTASGEDAGSILTLIDISALRQAQRKREETLRFISHDMRSPQNSILALAQLQSDPATALPQPELLARVGQYASRTLALVDGFVRLARAEAADMQFYTHNLCDLLLDAADANWALAQQRDIAILCNDLPDAAYVMADQALLTRAFANLIDNAIKYSPDHTRIDCSIRADGDAWQLTIQDQGRGIPADRLPTIFMPFTRADEHIPGNPAGTGLGLAFVQTIILRHSGTIAVESREGQGTVFLVRLPVAPTPFMT